MELLYMRVLVILMLCFLFAIPTKLGWCDGYPQKPLCRGEEREALLSFKRSIHDPYNKLSSWTTDECCKWDGVGCHNTTGHVLELDLSSRFLGDEISSSLLQLKHLRHLDLSGNDFSGQNIPKFLGSISNLRYLHLSYAGFHGVIPCQLGNLSNLHDLDIGGNSLLYAEDLEWLSSLTSLKFLDMTYVNLSRASNWLQVMNNLPSLSELLLFGCDIYTIDPLPHVNFSSLTTLDLSENYFISSSFDWFADLSSLINLYLTSSSIHGPLPLGLLNMTSLRSLILANNNLASHIPDWFYHMTTLEDLDLSFNDFKGEIPKDIGNLTSITDLDLSHNALEGEDTLRSLANLCSFKVANLSYDRAGKTLKVLNLKSNELKGPLPDILGECKNLEVLDLRMNHLSGQIPISFGGMSSLHYLDLGMNCLFGQIPVSLGGISSLSFLYIDQNSFKGVIFEKHLANLTSLIQLEASSNPLLTLQISSNWTPPFQLSRLGLGSCFIGPQFPAWLQTQMYLKVLNMSYARISCAIPAWFWAAPFLERVDLSQNQIIGNIPGLHFPYVQLSSNNFSGPLPQISFGVQYLDLSNNLFRGSLSPMLCEGTREFKLLSVLDLSGNFLTGELPDCWMYWSQLQRLELGNNNLTGHIPSSMGSLTFLGSLHLHNNHLSGNFPLPLKSCTNLLVLDLSENEFTGSIPAWVGNFYGRSIEYSPGSRNFTYTMGLKVLLLRSNKFNGSIPLELCRLDSLQILDLGNNNLSGTIHRCFGNFSSMIKPSNSSHPFGLRNNHSISNGGFDVATLVVKGAEYKYEKNLGLLVGIDLSCNKLSGEIPEDLTGLHGLIVLNLSHNHLHGKIPSKIGGLTSLESLDLSMNSLSGVIPQGLATISFLGHLNLSYNNLSGKIPTGTQIQGFSPLNFMGNPELCGPPLSDDHACPEDIKPKAPTLDKDEEEEEEDGWIDMKWLYFGMAWGFVVVFWGILGPLALNRAWRRAYFQQLDGVKYKLLGWCL